MRAKATILIIICLLFLVGTVAAVGIPDTVTITSDKSYLTANGVDQSTITVIVRNTTSGYSGSVNGAGVTFSLNNDPTLGTFNPVNTLTDTNGKATSIFKVNTKSGVADINAVVFYSDVNGLYNNFTILTQKIDHDKPNKIKFVPPYEGTVNTIVAFNASFTDQWGNPIDNQINLNQSHLVTLHVTGPSYDCNFVDLNNVTLGPDLYDIALDENGNVPMRIKLTSVVGSNYVSMEAFDLTTPPKVIRAIPGKPFYINQEFSPDEPARRPSGVPFTFTYTLYDKFMNPVGGQAVWVNMSSKQILATTQENGKISGTYEEIITGLYTLTATAVNNNSVTSSKIVEFYAAAATSHNVVVNPKMMPSRDVKSDIYSNISAKVVDGGGNGVDGQSVTFTISGISYSPTWVGNTSKPSFSPTSELLTINAITGADGNNGTATVKFYPGAFVTTGTNYSQSATGNATIFATWNSIPKAIDVSWKNYAYLSALLTITPSQVKVGDTVDVNLKLNGDGFSMTTKPIDVDLVIDRSLSMGSMNNPMRLPAAKDAAKKFVGIMSAGNNGVGLVSFASGTRLDMSLVTDNFNSVNTSIDALQADGYAHTTDGYTNMREALFTAINDIDFKGRDGSVKAVILLTDGDWNYNGSILGHGTGWLSDNPDYSNQYPSANDVIPNDYLYIPGLGGTLTPYSACSAYSSTVCDDCAVGYTGPGTVSPNIGKCRSSGGTWYTPGGRPSSCRTRHCNTLVTRYNCTNGEVTTQNMSIYAQTNGVRLYALSFKQRPSPFVETALTALTENTGGFYQFAATDTELNDLYTAIGNLLIEDAGVDTSADMDFGNLFVDDHFIDTSTSGNAVFDYVGDPVTPGINPGNSYTKAPGSTMIDKYNKTGNHLIPGPDFGTQIGPLIVNQTTDWNDNKALSFNIGLVKLGETWETNFRLRVLKEGTIMLFSPGSTINFKDYKGVESSLTLNNLSYLTAVKQPAGLEIQTINVLPNCPSQVQSKDPLVPIDWVTTYNGTATTVYEEGRYMSESGAWVIFYSKSYVVGGDDIRNRSTTFDLRSVQSGSYSLNIKAYTTGSKATSSPTCGPYYYNTTGIDFIKLR